MPVGRVDAFMALEPIEFFTISVDNPVPERIIPLAHENE